jgi:hypothetical protein
MIAIFAWGMIASRQGNSFFQHFMAISEHPLYGNIPEEQYWRFDEYLSESKRD